MSTEAGSLSCLNVAGGDITISFDTGSVGDVIRAKRIISDMLRRGYALLVEVDGAWQRAEQFDEKKGEYIIADFDPPTIKTDTVTASSLYSTIKDHLVPAEETDDEQETQKPTEEEAPAAPQKYKGRGRKRLPMAKTRAVGIARSAGG